MPRHSVSLHHDSDEFIRRELRSARWMPVPPLELENVISVDTEVRENMSTGLEEECLNLHFLSGGILIIPLWQVRHMDIKSREGPPPDGW